MLSRQKVTHTLASYPRRVTLYQFRWIRGAELVGAVVPLAVGLHVAFPHFPGSVDVSTRLDHVVLGLTLAAAAGAMLMLAVRDLRRVQSLTLDTKGFRISNGDHHVEYHWTDVQHFREVGDGAEFAVGFDLLPEPPGTRAEYYFRLRDRYGLRGTDLLSLLTQWHAKALISEGDR